MAKDFFTSMCVEHWRLRVGQLPTIRSGWNLKVMNMKWTWGPND